MTSPTWMCLRRDSWRRFGRAAQLAGDILELGFAHGKGSAFLGVLAKSRNATAVCVDNISALDRQPRADEVVAQVGLQDHVELVFADDGYLWWMKQQLELGSARRFSMIYLDGADDWFVDGFATLLLERFVKTGGVVIFDDLDWTFTSSAAPDIVERVSSMSRDVAEEPHVRKIWELLILPDSRWGEFQEVDAWAIARRISPGDEGRERE